MAGSRSSTSSRVRAMAVTPLMRAGAALAQKGTRLVQQLRGHGAVADARVVRFVDAQDAIDLRGADADADGRPAGKGGGDGGRDVLVGAGVEVQQGALRPLQQDRVAAGHRLLRQGGGVGHVGGQADAVVCVLGVYALQRQRVRPVQLRQDGVLVGHEEGEELPQRFAVQQVGDADAGTADLVHEGGADAAAGGADGAVPPQLLVQPVDQRVPGHQHLRAVAEEQPSLDGDAARLQPLDLLEEAGGVDDDAVADDANLLGVEDAGGHEMERELADFVYDGVTGVGAGGVPCDYLGLLRQQVYDAPLPLVPPLAPHDHDDWHKTARLRRTSPLLSVRREYRGRGRWGQGLVFQLKGS